MKSNAISTAVALAALMGTCIWVASLGALGPIETLLAAYIVFASLVGAFILVSVVMNDV